MEWLFSGVGLAVAGIIFNYFRKKPKNEEVALGNATNTNHITNTININSESVRGYKEPIIKNLVNKKDIIHILFIDNEKFNIVNTLKASGWHNTAYKQDIVNLQDPEILKAHIIFVDINGVGTKLFPKEHGRGLANALKDKYPDKKIILYSAETHGDRFDTIFRKVDYCLPKNAEPIQFINLVEQFSSEI